MGVGDSLLHWREVEHYEKEINGNLNKKSRVREIKNCSTNADSSTGTFLVFAAAKGTFTNTNNHPPFLLPAPSPKGLSANNLFLSTPSTTPQTKTGEERKKEK